MSEALRDPTPLLVGALCVGLGEDGADGRPHHLLGCFGHQREGVPHEVDSTPLPGGPYQHSLNGALQALGERRWLQA